MRVAFIGIGLMGRPMAGRVMAAGHSLTVHSRRAGSAAGLVAAGARWAASPQDAATDAEIVLTMLPDAAAVERVMVGPDGALGAGGARAAVDLSTIGPAGAVRVGRAAEAAGWQFVDAPVSGGPAGAESGTLSIMAGGDRAAYARVEPVLRVMGEPLHLGPLGAGQRTKLVNQVLIAGVMGGLAEAFALARHGGLDLGSTLEATRGGMGGSRLLDWAWPMLLQHDFSPGFKISHLVKDLRLALAEAEGLGLGLSTVRTVLDGYLRAADQVGTDAGTQALVAGVTGSHPFQRQDEELT